MSDTLRLVIRTPHAPVVDAGVAAARVPTRTGQLGLRPRQEPFVTVVEPGLVVLETGAGRLFAATAGGLLRADRDTALLITPFAVTGTVGEVLAALDEAYALPESELVTRRRLAELEQRIVRELSPRGRGHSDG
jgi:F0F1-type ATP synthase epsilon subunit